MKPPHRARTETTSTPPGLENSARKRSRPNPVTAERNVRRPSGFLGVMLEFLDLMDAGTFPAPDSSRH
ncbi:hypothetical protein [Luteolibacter marinus]|uniref:hypothetical protein n=1 Tax=Luteolibacter marinus TaxID=2776705 RepID=UPI00186761D4|nr:hypothetical protein [Luteolibacter marinus]